MNLEIVESLFFVQICQDCLPAWPLCHGAQDATCRRVEQNSVPFLTPYVSVLTQMDYPRIAGVDQHGYAYGYAMPQGQYSAAVCASRSSLYMLYLCNSLTASIFNFVNCSLYRLISAFLWTRCSPTSSNKRCSSSRCSICANRCFSRSSFNSKYVLL